MTPPLSPPVEDVDVSGAPGRTVPQPAEAAQTLRPYRAVSSLERIDAHRQPEPLKLDWNESTIPPSPLVLERIHAFLLNTHHLNWYPDQRAAELVTRLVRYTGRRAEEILVTSGSDAALDVLCQTYLDPGDEVVVPSPTYTHFLVYAGARGARIKQVYGENPFELDVEAIMASLSRRTKIVYLVSPNNPTGIVWPASVVARIARAVPQAIVIVDEAYFEFCGQSAETLVDTYSNVVVTRTFSKSFGIAGLRVGYLLGHESVVADVRRIFNPKSVNVLGQIAASAALDDLEYLYSYVDEVTRAKPILVEWLQEMGIEAISTPANFIMARVPHTGSFSQLCEDEGVYIRDRGMQPQLERYVRISVGTVAQTRDLVQRLGRVLARMTA